MSKRDEVVRALQEIGIEPSSSSITFHDAVRAFVLGQQIGRVADGALVEVHSSSKDVEVTDLDDGTRVYSAPPSPLRLP